MPTGQLNPVLAHWTYGLGRSVAFTSDAGGRWAKTWPDWQSYTAFWSQVIRWSMRPADRGNLTLNVRREQGRIKVVVDALDKNNEFLNFLQIRGNTVDPDLKSGPIELVQTAPGRYEGTIENAEASGNYFISLGYRGADNVQGVISSGVSVPYSDEYRELRSNPTTLETLASVTDGKVATWKQTPDGRVDLAAHRPGQRPLPPRRRACSIPARSRRCGRHSCGWRRACSWATSPSAGSRSTSGRDHGGDRQGVAEDHGPRSRGLERLHGQASQPQGRGRRTARPLQEHAARSSRRRSFMPPQAPSGPIGEPLLDGGEPGASAGGSAGRDAARPGHGRRPGRPRETELHQPPA